MNYSKQIVCLANSRKQQGRCIAGKEIKEGILLEWIRPVSTRPKGEISDSERRLKNGREPKLLDQPVELWPNGHSSVNGHNDRVPFSAAMRLKNSLS